MDDFFDADLSGADLREADLTRVSLFGADLSGAYLSCANLTGSDLEDADLTGADLTGANLTGAALAGAKGLRTSPQKIFHRQHTSKVLTSAGIEHSSSFWCRRIAASWSGVTLRAHGTIQRKNNV